MAEARCPRLRLRLRPADGALEVRQRLAVDRVARMRAVQAYSGDRAAQADLPAPHEADDASRPDPPGPVTAHQQDWAICERVRRGIGARVRRVGDYAPMEDLNLDMRADMRERMA